MQRITAAAHLAKITFRMAFRQVGLVATDETVFPLLRSILSVRRVTARPCMNTLGDQDRNVASCRCVPDLTPPDEPGSSPIDLANREPRTPFIAPPCENTVVVPSARSRANAVFVYGTGNGLGGVRHTSGNVERT
jgi:hypothetical protein